MIRCVWLFIAVVVLFCIAEAITEVLEVFGVVITSIGKRRRRREDVAVVQRGRDVVRRRRRRLTIVRGWW